MVIFYLSVSLANKLAATAAKAAAAGSTLVDKV